MTPTRPLGTRGLAVTALGLGCAPLGNLFTAVTEDDVQGTVDGAWSAGLRFFDTAPLYGHGLSESRLGAALRSRPRGEYVLASKVGRLLRTPDREQSPTIFAGAPPLEPVFDFSRAGVMRSISESLERLGTDRLDVVHVHDPDDHEQDALDSAFPALIELREEGVIGAVGCGMNQWEMLDRFVERVDLDCVLLAGRWTLLDRSGGEQLLPRCLERGVGVVIGGVFNSGLLADPDGTPVYDYAAAPRDLVARAETMRDACSRHGVSLLAAAIQFALRHPAVSSVVVGARTAAEIGADSAAAEVHVAEELWSELDTL
jgi:D-threo-aldose 1-dehydrogenase